MYANTPTFQAVSPSHFLQKMYDMSLSNPTQTVPTTSRVDTVDDYLNDKVFDREVSEYIQENRANYKSTDDLSYKLPFKTNIEITMDPQDESFLSAKRMAEQWPAFPENVDVSTPEKWILPGVNEETVYFNVRFIITRHFHTKMEASPCAAVVLGNMIMGKLISGTSYGVMDARITELAQKLHSELINRNGLE